MDFRKLSTAPALLDPDVTAPIYACPDCRDTGWKEVDGRASRCECKPRQQHADDVPFEFQQATFENFAIDGGNRTALTRALEFIARTTARDLYLCGGVGAGKSRLGCSILNEAHEIDPRVGWFVRVPMMLYRLQPGTGLSDEVRLAFEYRLFHAPLICLDDLGAERDVATDFTRRMLLMIYEERGDKGLRTIWTSNKTLGELSAMQDDDRLASRIVGRADVVNLTTADQRRVRRGR
jgi:DNA replication protein DnaC